MVLVHKSGLTILILWYFDTLNFDTFGTSKMNKNDQNDPQKDTLGTQVGPPKVNFGHFIDFGHFPIEAEKTTTMGRKGPRAKTK